MRGFLSIIIFLVILGSFGSIMGAIGLVMFYLLELNTSSLSDIHWYTILAEILYFIFSLKLVVKVSKSISNKICDYLE